MSSYQDTDWGHGISAAQLTDDPVPLSALEMLLSRLGYRLSAKNDPLSPFLFWEKTGSALLMTTKPDHRADGYDVLVYDRNRVWDQIMWCSGMSQTDFEHKIKAVLRDQHPEKHVPANPKTKTQQPKKNPPKRN